MAIKVGGGGASAPTPKFPADGAVFKIGDVVLLKSDPDGGTRMTVFGRIPQSKAGCVMVQWRDVGGRPHGNEYPEASLRLAP